MGITGLNNGHRDPSEARSVVVRDSPSSVRIGLGVFDVDVLLFEIRIGIHGLTNGPFAGLGSFLIVFVLFLHGVEHSTAPWSKVFVAGDRLFANIAHVLSATRAGHPVTPVRLDHGSIETGTVSDDRVAHGFFYPVVRSQVPVLVNFFASPRLMAFSIALAAGNLFA